MLTEPDYAFNVGTQWRQEVLTPDQPLVRVFNHVDAAAKGYEALSFNPSVPDLRGDVGGRFDATPVDRVSYLYAATTEGGIKVALWEVLLKNSVVDPASGKHIVPRSVVTQLTAQYFHVRRRLVLADIGDAASLKLFGASVDVLTCDESEYPCTRRWGAYLRAKAKRAAGLSFASRQTLGMNVGTSIVLYEDRCGPDPFIRGVAIPFDSIEGRLMLRNALRGTNFLIAR